MGYLPSVARRYLNSRREHLIQAYHCSSASFVAPLTFLQIVGAAIAGWLFFGDLPDLLGGLGMTIICVSGLASILVETRADKRTKAKP